jgi:hypothetical protein
MRLSPRFSWAASLLVPAICVLAACNNNAPDQKAAPKASTKPKQSAEPIAQAEGEVLGTPMAERVAVLGFLNKRNGQSRDVELKPGQDIRIGKVVIRLRACERTAPWENMPDHGAFVQLLVFERAPGGTGAERWGSRFSGWLFKENPSANVVQHPVYDIWVKECKMSFPGEEDTEKEAAADKSDGAPEAPGAAPKPAAKKPSSANQSPARAERAPEPEAEAADDEPVTEEATVEE